MDRLNESINVVNGYKSELNKLENRIREIKNDDKWKSAINYLRVAEYNGKIDQAPKASNDWRIPIIIK